MRPASTVLLDNEAVQALADPAHRKHRAVLATIEYVAARNLRRSGSVRLVVPTTVRVEAGWDRRVPRVAAINRLRVQDAELSTASADQAAALSSALSISVADAHLAACIEQTAGPHAVLTSDTDDLARIAAHLSVDLKIVAL